MARLAPFPVILLAHPTHLEGWDAVLPLLPLPSPDAPAGLERCDERAAPRRVLPLDPVREVDEEGESALEMSLDFWENWKNEVSQRKTNKSKLRKDLRMWRNKIYVSLAK
jgi:hypothetical protein